MACRCGATCIFCTTAVTVDPDERRLLVSCRIREEFENGREYYALDGKAIARPGVGFEAPSPDNLHYHTEQVYWG
ncbi:MAG: hypothetical protein ACR2J4_05765 [Deinococcus sp.]